MQPVAPAETETDAPFVFRTTSAEVYASTLASGELWLRSNRYYQQLEDKFRVDDLEGINGTSTLLPLRIKPQGGPEITIAGPGTIGQEIVPHYLACFHGLRISESQRSEFGGYTFGVKEFSRLAAEVLFHCSKQIRSTGYRYGPVSYRHSALSITTQPIGGAAIKLTDAPPQFLNPIDTDVLRKRPIQPFVEQDEWRIAIFTAGFLDEAGAEPLKIKVSTDHFFPYFEQSEHVSHGV